MRVIVAIVLLSVSVLTLGLGIAQRTVFAGDEMIARAVVTDTTAPATIIHGKDLAAYPGRVTLAVEGGVSARVPSGEGFAVVTSERVFVAYGRTIDVMAWLSPGRHTQLRFDPLADSFIVLPRTGQELTLPDPSGSDLWFQEYAQDGQISISFSVPEDVTVLIMSDGTLPAPQNITVSWPLVTDSLVSLALIVVGIGSMVAGFVMVLINYIVWRKNRGPRRRMTKRPRGPRGSYRQPRRSSIKPRGRRSVRFVAVPLAGTLLWGASGCVAEPAAVEAEETGNQVQAPAVVPYPAVTELQFSRIMAKIASAIQAADEEFAVNLLADRVSEPTLAARRAAYIIKRADPTSGTLTPILASPIRLVLPQQTSTWPRSVFGIIQDEDDLESPSVGVVLSQETPRSDYRLSYAVVLAPQVQIPNLPSASLGSARLSPDSGLIRLSPVDVAANYADVINQGTSSPYALDFALATDRLFIQLGPEAAALRQESFGDTVDVQWETTPSDNEVVAFATADGGALVMATLQETERVTPAQSGASVNASIAVRALTSLSQSTRGFEVISNIQVLWYVPPVGSDEGVRVLGYTYSLVGAKEVDSD
ncbi:MAG: hypothetical protein K9G09_01245 [Pontimonas sp.]|nr:hypothetical protein [Pontimonas sp.]